MKMPTFTNLILAPGCSKTCSEASRGEFVTHSLTTSNKRPLGGGLWLDLCLNFKEKSRGVYF
jgi:hypothetical protein